MQLFYSGNIKNDVCILDENESRHCVRVLRLSKGSAVNVIDGKGNLYEGLISIADSHSCEIRIMNVIVDFEKRDYRLHLAISPVKNNERFEWFVEKSVEIGIDEITPLICRNTERTGIKQVRLGNIIVSAMKQSVKAFRPRLNSPASFEEFINRSLNGINMIATCDKGFERSKIDQVYKKGSDATILIGPEGDFTSEEVSEAVEKGYVPVHLGNSRLRTETAGIAACHSIYFINQ